MASMPFIIMKCFHIIRFLMRCRCAIAPPPLKFWMLIEHVVAQSVHKYELSGDPDQCRSPKRGSIVAVLNFCINK